MIPKLLRVLLAAGIVLGSSFLALPAPANHTIVLIACPPTPSPEPTPTPTPSPEATPEPEPACVPDEGEVITGTRQLRFVVTAPIHAVSRIKATIVGDEEALEGESVVLLDEEFESPPSEPVNRIVDWDSVEQTPLNGRYRFVVEAEASSLSGAHTSRAERKDLLVDNPPQRPGAPVVAEVTTSNISVEWAKAPEDDVTGYILYRAATDASATPQEAAEELEVIALPTTESYLDEDVEAGMTYRYALRVLRRSVVFPHGVWSALGPMSDGESVSAPAPDLPSPRPSGSVRGTPRSRAAAPPVRSRVTTTPQATFAYEIPYDEGNAVRGAPQGSESGTDPRGAMLPVAVGAFLVSAALALGRMPY